MRKRRGFTLIELIAVIAILGVLAVMLVPNIIGFTNKSRVIKAQSDAGIIIRAIDAYEAENTHVDQSTVVVTQNTLAGASNNEDTLTLDDLVNTDSALEIIGGNAAIKAIPNEYTSNGKSIMPYTRAQIKIGDLRKIAARQITITIDYINGRVDKVDGVPVGY